MPEYMYSVIGTVGALLILIGFYRTSIGQWKTKSFWYELDNAVGAILLIIYQAHLGAYISVVLNAVWAFVAFKGLTSFAERYQGRKKSVRKRS